MKIIEQQLRGKHSQEKCEDGIVVTPDFVAVIDGSTSKTRHRINPDMENGRYGMMLIAEFIRKINPEVSLDEFCRGVTAHIFKYYPTNGQGRPATIPPQDRLCASAIVYSRHHHQIWMIGDCQCLINGTLYENHKPYEERLATVRAKVFERCCHEHQDMIDGRTIVRDYARDMILPDLIEAMQNQNKTYAVIDGYPIFSDGIKKIEIEDADCEVVLASDGYPFLKPTLDESEEALRLQLTTDPFNIKTFKATKGLMKGNCSFDDRAYIRFRC